MKSEVPRLKFDTIIFIVSILIFLSAVFYIFVVFEQPDEYAHIERLIEMDRGGAGLYYWIMGGVLDIFRVDYLGLLDIFVKNDDFIFARNNLICLDCHGNSDYYLLRIVNLIFVLFLVLALSSLIENKIVYFASLIWPSVFYVLSGVGSDSFAVPLVIAAACLMIEGKMWLSFALGLASVYLDRSGFVLIIFQVAYFCVYKFEIRLNKLLLFAPLVIFFIPVTFFFDALPFWGEYFNLIRETSDYNYQYDINLVNRSISLLLSFWYLAGNLSITAFYFEYFIFGILFFVMVYFSNSLEVKILFAAIFALVFIIWLVPTLAQARYYLYIIPLFVSALMRQGRLVSANGLIVTLASFNFLYSLKFLFIYLIGDKVI